MKFTFLIQIFQYNPFHNKFITYYFHILSKWIPLCSWALSIHNLEMLFHSKHLNMCIILNTKDYSLISVEFFICLKLCVLKHFVENGTKSPISPSLVFFCLWTIKPFFIMGYILCVFVLQISLSSPACYSQSLSHYKNLPLSHLRKHAYHYLVLLGIIKYYLGQETDLKKTNLYLFCISLLLVLYFTRKCNSSLTRINKQHFLSLGQQYFLLSNTALTTYLLCHNL